jgi:mannose-1-phosphate guanylyltransferase
MRALILAAGRGERFQPFTERVPKPAIPFLNVPIMGFPMFYLEEVGLTELVVNTHHLPAEIQAMVQGLIRSDVKVHFSHETPEILGSGGGLAQAAKFFSTGEEILIANADAVALFPSTRILGELYRRHRDTKALATLLVCPFPLVKEKLGGVYVDSQGKVVNFSKQNLTNILARPWHFTGYIVVSSQLLNGLTTQPSNILYDVLLPMIQQGARVSALCVSDIHWFETGNLADYLSATEASLKILTGSSWAAQCLQRVLTRFTPEWRKGFRQEGAIELVACPRPSSLNVTGFAVMGPGVRIEENVNLTRAVISGKAVLGQGQAIIDDLIL